MINRPEVAPSGAGEGGDPADAGRDRQRGVRCHGRSHPPRAVVARLREIGVVVESHLSPLRGEVERRG